MEKHDKQDTVYEVKLNKIDFNYKEHRTDKTEYYTNMKPIYSTDANLLCGIINYDNKTYYLDLNDKDRIINFNKNFVFTSEEDLYPSYCYNYKRFTYLDFIFQYNKESVYYHFKNGNQLDLRRCNVDICHYYHKNIIEKYKVVDYIEGHYYQRGQDANIMKNPMWKIQEDDTYYLLMYCEKDTICKLCPESYQKILDFEKNVNEGKKITWFKHLNGYISSSLNIFIHQAVMNCYGNGKGTSIVSVDHIDRNPLNNTIENLRIATRKDQENNCKGIINGTKRERKTSAKPLPEGLTQQMLKKYVVYYHEWLNKEKTRSREFFKIEKHPKLDKIWVGTKSNKTNILDKLQQANSVVDDLENDIYPTKKENVALPKYISLITMREKPHIVYEKRVENGIRENLKMILPDNYDLEEQLQVLQTKIKEKYNHSV
jgi:hypothetical protein